MDFFSSLAATSHLSNINHSTQTCISSTTNRILPPSSKAQSNPTACDVHFTFALPYSKSKWSTVKIVFHQLNTVMIQCNPAFQHCVESNAGSILPYSLFLPSCTVGSSQSLSHLASLMYPIRGLHSSTSPSPPSFLTFPPPPSLHS